MGQCDHRQQYVILLMLQGLYSSVCVVDVLCKKSLHACVAVDVTHGRQLMIGPSDVDAELGDTVLLECAAKKYTRAAGVSQIVWTRDGQYLFDC